VQETGFPSPRHQTIFENRHAHRKMHTRRHEHTCKPARTNSPNTHTHTHTGAHARDKSTHPRAYKQTRAGRAHTHTHPHTHARATLVARIQRFRHTPRRAFRARSART
jgi:hypothetical protein